MDTPSTLPFATPPTDHVARALIQAGARDEALALLRATVARDPEERACAALVRALEARPDAAVSGPDVRLDLQLVDAYAARGMLLEALAVLHGARLDQKAAGRQRVEALGEVLAPTPSDAPPQLAEALAPLATGGAALTLSMLEDLAQAAPLPEWADRRRQILRWLLLDQAANAQPATPPESIAVFRGAAASIANRDLLGALEAVRAHASAHPGDATSHVFAEALGQLVAYLEARAPEALTAAPALSTLTMGTQQRAELYLRMGNFVEAEKLLRRLLLEGGKAETRALLGWVQTVRGFLEKPSDPLHETMSSAPTRPVPVFQDEEPETSPDQAPLDDLDEGPTRIGPAPTAAVAAAPPPATASSAGGRASPLHKTGARSEGGWGAPVKTPPPDASWDDGDATSAIRPELEAELLLKQGYTDRALRLYRTLVRQNPGKKEYQARLTEIERMVFHQQTPLAGDLTVRRDMSGVAKTAEQPEKASPSEGTFEDDEPTIIGRTSRSELALARTAVGSDSPIAKSASADASAIQVIPAAVEAAAKARAAPVEQPAVVDTGVVRIARIVRVG